MSRTANSLAQLAQHEVHAFGNQIDGLRERVSVARRARSFGELVRNQLDLLPDTHSRLRRDHAQRERLLRDLSQQLTGRAA